MYDYLVVGCGLFGSVFARIAADRNKTVLIIDKRNHIGGNCYSEKIEDIHVHKYGPHVFHANSDKIWNFVNRFATFSSFIPHTKVNHNGQIFSFPVNLMTLHQLWGTNTPLEAKQKLAEKRLVIENPSNLEEWILSQVGEEIYEIFIKGYTTKQWGRPPNQLPAFIIKRLPIRLTYDDRYFDDKHQGVPSNGYTRMFENMLDHPNIKIELEVDFFNNKSDLLKAANKTVFSGKIDQFYNYQFGELEYRSLRFESQVLEGDFQGAAVINYTSAAVPYTRIIEHKHFEYKTTNKTVVTWEYPDTYDQTKIPYYPINNNINNEVYNQYKNKSIADTNMIFGGRLGSYCYFNMDQVVGSAMATAEKELR